MIIINAVANLKNGFTGLLGLSAAKQARALIQTHKKGCFAMAKTQPSVSKARSIPKPSFSLARRVSTILGSVPSLIWAGVYLLLIPLFAGLYMILPEESFYQSTIVHDANYKKDQKLFETDVEVWAQMEITPRLMEAIERVESRRPEEIKYYAGYPPGQFWPELFVSAKFDNKQSLDLDYHLGGMIHVVYTKDMAYSPPKITAEYSEGFDLMAQCKKEEEEATCKAKLVENELKPDRYFAAPAYVKDRVYKLRTQATGLNSGMDIHSFTRMVYLSAVTITTVGYGDIVPLTDAARIAVSCEAITGIILIGLFLNAVAYERQLSTSRLLEQYDIERKS